MTTSPPGAPAPDPSTLPSITAGSVLRAIDPDDIEGWLETEQRWVLASNAMKVDHLTPGAQTGFGYSVFVPHLIVARCATSTAHEIHFLQRHAHQHQCWPSWQDGVVARAPVVSLAALGFGVGESPADGPCDETRAAHASVWRDPRWTKKQARTARDAALVLLGSDTPFEDSERIQLRISTRASLIPGGPTSGGQGTPSTP